MTTTHTADKNLSGNHAANHKEAHMANFELGQVVVNFGTTAMVVGFFQATDGPSEHDGHPILRELSADRRRFVGDKWLADPAKCEAAR